MQNKYYPLPLFAILGVATTGAGLAHAQTGEGARVAQLEEVIVTAQRRDENIQDVPMTVTAITGNQVKDLNIFRFEDIQQLSPGLTLESQGAFGSVAQLRGVGFDSNASASPAVDIYFNETPVDANYAFQSIYDIGQIEVLRGPQGTLRGRPAPGGAVTLVTRQPDLEGWGATLFTSAGNRDTINGEAALNIPLVENKLAARIAGIYSETDGNDVRSVNSGREEGRDTDSWRLSLRWAPTDSLDATLTHQSMDVDRVSLTQVEGPGAGYNGPAIRGRGLSVMEANSGGEQESDITTLALSWDLGHHRLIYNAGLQDNEFRNFQELDSANAVLNYLQDQNVVSSFERETHELRLESAGDGRLNYVVGAWYEDTDTFTTFAQAQPLDGAFGNPLMPSPVGPPDDAYLLPVFGGIGAGGTNEALYGNIAFELTEATEINLGARYLRDDSDRSESITTGSGLIAVGIVPGVPLGLVIPGGCVTLTFVEPTFTGNEPFDGYCDLGLAESEFARTDDNSHSEWVYTGSLKHNFSDSLMTYLTYGHSWRPAGTTVGLTAPVSDDLVQGDPEESDSYEIGLRSTWFDGRVRLNASLFHQDFENFIGRFNEVPFLGAGGTVQSAAGFTYPGDAKVNGGEVDLAWEINDSWWAQLTYARADGRFDDARVPCRDTNLDGIPDDGDIGLLTPEDFGDQSAIYCVVNNRISTAPERSATLQSEYSFPLLTGQGYVRALYTYAGSESDSTREFQRDSYSILNLYVGIRGLGESWELSLWGRNILDEEERLTMGQPQTLYGAFNTGYSQVTYTPRREVGATLRYVFGNG